MGFSAWTLAHLLAVVLHWAARGTLSLSLKERQQTARSQISHGNLQGDREGWGDGRVPGKRGERWLILAHPKAGGKRGKSLEEPRELWVTLVSSRAQHSGF